MTPASRMALQYVLLFTVNGISLPFAGLWLSAQGFSASQIGGLLAAPMLARLVTGPLIAVWADGFRRRRTPIAILGAVACFAYIVAGLGDGLWVQGGAWFLAATALSALIPLTDVLSLQASRTSGFAFAWPRGCGSAAFVVANVLMGAMLSGAPVDSLIVVIALASGLLTVSAATLLPIDGVIGHSRARDRFVGVGRLARQPTFMIALVAVGAIQATHAFYYGFSALAWKAQGIDERTTGLLWAFSVVVEIGFMWWGEPWRRRLGIGSLTVLAAGGLAAVARWLALAFDPPLLMLWPLQALHALTFAATYLAGVELIERLSPPGQQTTAQTLNSVMASGVLIGLATLASGPLYEAFGTAGYLAMSALAGGGLVCAWHLRRRIS